MDQNVDRPNSIWPLPKTARIFVPHSRFTLDLWSDYGSLHAGTSVQKIRTDCGSQKIYLMIRALWRTHVSPPSRLRNIPPWCRGGQPSYISGNVIGIALLRRPGHWQVFFVSIHWQYDLIKGMKSDSQVYSPRWIKRFGKKLQHGLCIFGYIAAPIFRKHILKYRSSAN